MDSFPYLEPACWVSMSSSNCSFLTCRNTDSSFFFFFFLQRQREDRWRDGRTDGRAGGRAGGREKDRKKNKIMKGPIPFHLLLSRYKENTEDRKDTMWKL